MVNAGDIVKPFYQTGVTAINTISLTGGSDKSTTYFSYGNISNKGIVPGATLSRNNLTFRQTGKFLNDKLIADGSVNLIDQIAHNRPVSGLYSNPLTGLYTFPRGLDFQNYQDNYTQYYAPRNLDLQNWYNMNPDGSGGLDFQQNPFWVINRMQTVSHRQRAIVAMTLKYQFNNWLTLQARGNYDKTWDVFKQSMYAGTQSVQAASNGRYANISAQNTQIYGDLILSANKKLNQDLNLVVNLGTSINDNVFSSLGFDEDPTSGPGLVYANKFSISEISPVSEVVAESYNHKQLQALFASVQLGYKNFLYVDLTGRNDWSSTFAFTPTNNKRIFLLFCRCQFDPI